LQRAYQRVDSDSDADADAGYLTSVVLMTDGENNAGISAGISVDDFLAGIQDASEHVRSVKTFAIRFGEADPVELQQVTTATGGAVFDAVGGSLAAAFKEIRGYQ
jgi:Ca-activated chloride channel homolog